MVFYMVDNRKSNIFDAMTVVGFLIGLAKYDENITQSDLQDMMKCMLKDVHEHLEEQDNKIDNILELLKEGKQNE